MQVATQGLSPATSGEHASKSAWFNAFLQLKKTHTYYRNTETQKHSQRVGGRDILKLKLPHLDKTTRLSS